MQLIKQFGGRGNFERAVHELAEGVHERLRVNDDVDARVVDSEQKVRFDHFQRLVDERRGIDRDFLPHPPGRMVEGLRRGN